MAHARFWSAMASDGTHPEITYGQQVNLEIRSPSQYGPASLEGFVMAE